MRPSIAKKIAIALLGWGIAIVMFFPIFWMFITGFKSEVDAVSTPPHLFFHPTCRATPRCRAARTTGCSR